MRLERRSFKISFSFSFTDELEGPEGAVSIVLCYSCRGVSMSGIFWCKFEGSFVHEVFCLWSEMKVRSSITPFSAFFLLHSIVDKKHTEEEAEMV